MYNILLNKETNNLIKINKLARKANAVFDGEYLGEIIKDFKKIKTAEHREKVEFYLELIDIYERYNYKNSTRGNDSK